MHHTRCKQQGQKLGENMLVQLAIDVPLDPSELVVERSSRKLSQEAASTSNQDAAEAYP